MTAATTERPDLRRIYSVKLSRRTNDGGFEMRFLPIRAASSFDALQQAQDLMGKDFAQWRYEVPEWKR